MVSISYPPFSNCFQRFHALFWSQIKHQWYQFTISGWMRFGTLKRICAIPLTRTRQLFRWPLINTFFFSSAFFLFSLFSIAFLYRKWTKTIATATFGSGTFTWLVLTELNSSKQKNEIIQNKKKDKVADETGYFTIEWITNGKILCACP